MDNSILSKLLRGQTDVDAANITYGKALAKRIKNSDRIQEGQPLNYEGAIDAATNIPVVGDLISGGLAVRDAMRGNYGDAALNAASVLPFVSAGIIKNSGFIPKNKTWPKELENERVLGIGNLPKSETYDSAGNVMQDMRARIALLKNGDYAISAIPPWTGKNKPFYAVGDDPEELADFAVKKLNNSDSSIKASRTKKIPKEIRENIENEFGKVFDYDISNAANSGSYYITHNPTGTKIRVSDHDLPGYYENTSNLDIRSDDLTQLPYLLRQIIDNNK